MLCPDTVLGYSLREEMCLTPSSVIICLFGPQSSDGCHCWCGKNRKITEGSVGQKAAVTLCGSIFMATLPFPTHIESASDLNKVWIQINPRFLEVSDLISSD